MSPTVKALEFPLLQHPIIWRSAVSVQDVMRMRMLLRSCNVFSEAQIEAGCAMLQARLDNPAIPTQFLFALQHYELVGNACFGRIPFTEKRFELHWLTVHPAHQQHGIAEIMLQRCEDIIRTQGGVKLYANTPSRESFAPARALFEASGFNVEARQKEYYSEGDDRIIFAKIL